MPAPVHVAGDRVGLPAEHPDRVSGAMRSCFVVPEAFMPAIRVHLDGLDGGADPGHDGIVLAV